MHGLDADIFPSVMGQVSSTDSDGPDTMEFNLASELKCFKDQLHFATFRPSRSQASPRALPNSAVECTGLDRHLHSRTVVHTNHKHRSSIVPRLGSARHLCRKLL